MPGSFLTTPIIYAGSNLCHTPVSKKYMQDLKAGVIRHLQETTEV